jgi:hypothetical protein
VFIGPGFMQLPWAIFEVYIATALETVFTRLWTLIPLAKLWLAAVVFLLCFLFSFSVVFLHVLEVLAALVLTLWP